MGEEGERAAGGPDLRFDVLQTHVVAGLKIKEDAFQKLITGETRTPFVNFLDTPEATLLLIYNDGKDLTAVSARRRRRGRTTPARPRGCRSICM
eukprot:365162-Chlamydomonas_euryale.AAC.19